MNRNEVEGIRVGGANGSSDNYFSDYASFAEIAIKAVGQSASMPVPGTLGQYVSKSGGNAYHGAVYADFQNEAMQATNIDAAQIASGVAGGPHLDVHDVNRLQGFGTSRPTSAATSRKTRRGGIAPTATPASGSATRGCSTRRRRWTAKIVYRQADLQPDAAAQADRLRAAAARGVRQLQLHELGGPAGSDQRCADGHAVHRVGVEGRIQRVADRCAVLRGARRRVSLRRRSDVQVQPRRASWTSARTPSAVAPCRSR